TGGSLAEELEPTAQAIVCAGAGITNVVVHRHGVPEFVRMLGVGGDDITQGIATELAVDADTAEDLKRRADFASGDDLEAREARLLESEALLSVPIGLALAARPPESGVRRISVLPTEVAVVRAQRRQVAAGLLAVAALAVLLLLVWLARMSSVHNEQDRAKRA